MPFPSKDFFSNIKHHLIMRKLYSLKSFFITCLLLMVGALGAWAQGTTVTFTAGTDNSTGTTIEKGGVTISVKSGTFDKATQYYRSDKGSSLTVASNVGIITKIVFTSTVSGTAKGGPGHFKTTVGDYSYSGTVGTWDGNASTITFSNVSNQVRLSKIEVTYTSSGTVSAPKFSAASTTFTDPFQVTLTAEEGADIYYTTNGDDPTTSSTKYTAPIDITTTTTLKAIAVKDGKTSSVATATYTLDTPLASFEEIKLNGVSGEKYRLTFNDAVVTYVNGRNVYTEDATGGLLLYLNSGHGLEAGQKLNGTCEVTYTLYGGTTAELTAIDKSALTITSDAVIPTTTVTIADLLDNMQKYQSMHVKVVNAKVTSAFSSKKATIEQDGSSIQVFQKASFTMSEFVNGATVNLEGFPGFNNSTKQFHVWSADDIEVAGNVKAPTLSENTQKFTTPLKVTITAAEGTAVYYTIDGTDPKTSDTKKTYNAGDVITITATTTLRAVAEKDNVYSDETTATYSYRAPSDNDGSFAKPYTAEEVLDNGSELKGKTVWVKGTLLGAASSSGSGFDSQITKSTATIALGTDNGDALQTSIAVNLGSSSDPIRKYITENSASLIGKEILVYGNIVYGKYYGRYFNMKNGSDAFAGTEESPIATLSVRTEEGYATFVSKLPFFVPEGVECATVTEADGNGVLNFDYKYKKDSETYDVVPANYPVLVKADGKNTFNLVIASARKGTSNGTNLLKAGTDSEIAAEVGHYYYKLAYDNFDTKEGLGFYWGATDGGAFTVPTGSAYLDIESTGTTALKSFRFDNATTGISTPVVNGQSEAVKVAYTLDGRRVDAAHLTKGLYIVNGKKVIVK